MRLPFVTGVEEGGQVVVGVKDAAPNKRKRFGSVGRRVVKQFVGLSQVELVVGRFLNG